jgi:D-glycero-D-manno-heptose 1,7-bisphosphate phosphatase
VLTVPAGGTSIVWENFASVSSSSEESKFLEEDGIWCQRAVGGGPVESARRRPALILDRDGVIVEEVGYLHRPGDVRLVPGAVDVIATANRADVPVVVVTNQSGIGRGHYGWADFMGTQACITAALRDRGARLDMVVACPFHADGVPPYKHKAHPCRKPQPGMILRAGERLGLDLARSWIVGDRATDMAAGRAAGLAGGLHVLTGHGAKDRNEVHALATEGFQVRLADSMSSALELVALLKPDV